MAFLVDTGLLSIPHCSLSLSLSLSLSRSISTSRCLSGRPFFFPAKVPRRPTLDSGTAKEKKTTTQRRCKSPVCLPLSQLTLRSGPSAEANKEQHTNTQSHVSEWTSKKRTSFLSSFLFRSQTASQPNDGLTAPPTPVSSDNGLVAGVYF